MTFKFNSDYTGTTVQANAQPYSFTWSFINTDKSILKNGFKHRKFNSNELLDYV